MDKAKGFVGDHKGQVRQGLDKAKQTAQKAGDSVNRAATKRLPNTGTMTPVGQPAAPEAEGAEEAAEAETESLTSETPKDE
jgi:hypothetical protein